MKIKTCKHIYFTGMKCFHGLNHNRTQNFGWSEYNQKKKCLSKSEESPIYSSTLTVITENAVWGVYVRLAAQYSQFPPFPMASTMGGNGQPWATFSESAETGHALHSSRRCTSKHTTSVPQTYPTTENHETSRSNMKVLLLVYR